MAVRIQRIYTRKGDQGGTGLIGGVRVSKGSQRVEAYGTVDELNASVALTRAFNQEMDHSLKQRLDEILVSVQNTLFDLGSELATPKDQWREGMLHVGEAEVRAMERLMDELQEGLDPLRAFVLPGGGRLSASLHQCRTVCRRAEREVCRLEAEGDIGKDPIRCLNRLSDLFFVLSRWVAKGCGEREQLWESTRGFGQTPGGRF